MKTRTFLAATCVSAALAAASNAQTITSTAYSQDDLANDGSTAGAFMTATTAAGKTIGEVATNVNVALSDSGPDLDTMTLHVTGSGYDFFYDLSFTAYQSEGGTETAVAKRYNSGRAMPSSGLGGQHRQRIDSPDTVGAGNWEFVRLTVGNVVNNGGTPVTLLGFNSIHLDSLNPGDNGNIEDVNNSGAVIDAWVGNALSFDQIIDLSDTYTASVDLVGTGNAGGNNANRPKGFAVDFQVGAGGGSDIKLTITPGSTSGAYDFSWTSQVGKVYDLVSSTDLSTAPADWLPWDGRSGLPATAPTNVLTDVPGGSVDRRFFAVVEKGPPAPLLENGSFEDPVLADDGFGSLGTPWNTEPATLPGGSTAETWNPPLSAYDLADFPEGENVCSIYFDSSAPGSTYGVSQVLTETYSVDTEYAVTVKVGRPAGLDWPGFRIELWAGGTLLKADDDDTLGATAPTAGNFITSTISYDPTTDPAGTPGDALEIRLLSRGVDVEGVGTSVNGWAVDFDEVAVTATGP